MSELQLMTMFCDIDDFCKAFAPMYTRHLLQTGQRHRQRQTTLALSEIMTLLVSFHCSHYRTFKHSCTEHVEPHLRPYFPQLVRYTRFVELMPQALLPLCRPHMLRFNHTHSHAIVSYVATGHVLFLDAATHAPVACIDVGEQAHEMFPSSDQSHAVVANQNGKLLQRLRTDYAANAFALEGAATLDLARCRTPSGAACEDAALRPDNAPICPIIDSTGRFTFVTLRGGGLLVVDSTATPMVIVAEYDRHVVHPNGCGGSEAAGKMSLRAGGGSKADPVHADLYAFPLSRFSAWGNAPNTPEPVLVFSHDNRHFVDAHGGALTKAGRFLWVGDRFANRLAVVDTASDKVVNEIALSGRVSSDPAPDVMDVSPGGDWIFMSLRGPRPLSANVPGVDNAVSSTPGVGVVRVEASGWRGEMVDVAPIRRVVDGVELADPHGLKVRWP